MTQPIESDCPKTGLIEQISDQTPLHHDNDESSIDVTSESVASDQRKSSQDFQHRSSCCIHLKETFLTRAEDTQDPILMEVWDDIMIKGDTQMFDVPNEDYRMYTQKLIIREIKTNHIEAITKPNKIVFPHNTLCQNYQEEPISGLDTVKQISDQTSPDPSGSEGAVRCSDHCLAGLM